MKILMVTNQVRTYALGFQNLIGPLTEMGHEVIWAANFSHFFGDKAEIPIKTFHIDIESFPTKSGNIRAFKSLLKIIDNEGIEAIRVARR